MNLFLKTLFRFIPSDYFSRKYPVSVKGILLVNGQVVLLKNEREEWELPGGKLDPSETPEKCVIREISEELNLKTSVHSLIDVWLYNVSGKVQVLIVTFLCKCAESDKGAIRISNEHKEVGLFREEEIPDLNMPQGYKNSIFKALSGETE